MLQGASNNALPCRTKRLAATAACGKKKRKVSTHKIMQVIKGYKRGGYFPLLVGCWALSFTSACLKTRTQLREDAEDPVPALQPQKVAPVSEVHPIAGGGYALDEVKSEMTRMAGRLDELERAGRDSSLKKEKAEGLKELEVKVAGLEQQLLTLEANFLQLQQLQLQQQLQQQKRPQTAGELEAFFHEGVRESKQKHWGRAVEGLTSYLDSGQAVHAEEASFLRAESYFHLKEYKKAVLDFKKFPEKWKHSKRVPEAVFQIGNCFAALKLKEDAKSFYHQVTEQFPKSPFAQLARLKLQK